MTIPQIKYWQPIWLSTARFFGVVRSRCALQRLITRLAEELGSEVDLAFKRAAHQDAPLGQGRHPPPRGAGVAPL